MSIIDKMGRKPDTVTELDNGDVIYSYGAKRFRYAIDGVWVSIQGEKQTFDSHGLECRLNEDDTIEQFEWATSWAWLAYEGDEPIYELGRHLCEAGGDMTPSGFGKEKNLPMKLWFEIPGVWVNFQMEDDLIKMEDCFTGDVWHAQTVHGALDRLAWLTDRAQDEDLWNAINEEKDRIVARDAELYGTDTEAEEEKDESAN